MITRSERSGDVYKRQVFILFTGSDDIYIRAGIVFLGESRLRIQSRGYCVAAVDDGGVAVFKLSLIHISIVLWWCWPILAYVIDIILCYI